MPTTTLSALRAATAAALVLLGGLTAACSDAPSAPSAPRAPSAARPSLSASETTTRTVTYRSRESLDESLGSGHRLTMPAGAVCDPKTAGYGPGTWDSPCTALRGDITFTATLWTDAAGRPQVTFHPDVRFVPGKVVTLRLRDREASITAGSAIVWCPTGQATCVDESRTDASLTTFRDPNGMFVYRRLKHFSGYNVVVDRSGEGGGDEGTGFGGGF